AANSPQLVDVNLVVYRPVIEVSARQFEFGAFEGGANPNDQILSISNSGTGVLDWTIGEGCSWLSAEPNSGSSTGEVDDVNLSVDITGLAGGIYDCNLIISGAYAANSPQMAGVTLYVRIDDGELHVPLEYSTIQGAIDDASGGDTVIVAPGRYTGDGNRDIEFLGKAITVRSVDPNDPCVVAGTIIDCNGSNTERHRGFNLNCFGGLCGFTITNGYALEGGGIRSGCFMTTISKCIIRGNAAVNDGGGIYLGEGGVIEDCLITGNRARLLGGGIGCRRDIVTISNCVITGNKADFGGGGIGKMHSSSELVIRNCTIADNYASHKGGGIYSWEKLQLTITNSIIWNNEAGDCDYQLALDAAPLGDTSKVWISYSDIEGGCQHSCMDGHVSLYCLGGNIDLEPDFAEAGHWVDSNDPNIVVEPNDPNGVWVGGDYHLRSEGGRWDPNSESWVVDANASACIDAGDPNSDWTEELWPHGGRINMGAYGGTAEASMSLPSVWDIADIDKDGEVDFVDFEILASQWEDVPGLPSADIAPPEGDGIVDGLDLGMLVGYWLYGVTVPAGPIAHWKFDEGSGTTAYDSVGENHGTLVGDVNWTDGQIGGALEFDGVDDYVDLSFTMQFDNNNFTITGWFRTNSDTTGRSEQIWNSGYNGGNHDLEVDMVNNGLHFYARDASGSYLYRITYNGNDGIWHHFAVLRRGNDFELYFDGGIGAPVWKVLGDLDAVGVVPRIGNGLNGIHNRHFDGIIDDVRVYDRALTGGEVWQLYQDGL
ncbi:MAG: LamG-like jellyroll fold domain-containing protein, partial [Planctomycetota bacterium]